MLEFIAMMEPGIPSSTPAVVASQVTRYLSIPSSGSMEYTTKEHSEQSERV